MTKTSVPLLGAQKKVRNKGDHIVNLKAEVVVETLADKRAEKRVKKRTKRREKKEMEAIVLLGTGISQLIMLTMRVRKNYNIKIQVHTSEAQCQSYL